ncbi:hypothetical protein Slin15195_G091840 [Septoria linicola]|uniref:Uncharacterized protein n=1 Tax=Septoria linicola TaxID=215465 RepID=A0A9Q9AVF7_9PEZI|nr:hypothetical protein Slin14017_G054990 [Septoria linicola]USW55865.1 hypothetical protein Slin15195_G091840 [Septoria linicola]
MAPPSAEDRFAPDSTTQAESSLLPRADIRGGTISDKNRVKLSPTAFNPVFWEKSADASEDPPVSPKTRPADNDTTAQQQQSLELIPEAFESLDQIQVRMEKEYGGRDVYEFVTG